MCNAGAVKCRMARAKQDEQLGSDLLSGVNPPEEKQDSVGVGLHCSAGGQLGWLLESRIYAFIGSYIIHVKYHVIRT